MKREIKFRAWDANDNTMIGPLKLCRVISSFYGLSDEEWAAFEWMQFTGLRDKLGREIYEGDVVCHRYAPSQVVEYDDVHSGFIPFNGDINCPHAEFESEVIGNIYENPELLK